MLPNYNIQYKNLIELKNKRKENVSIVFFINTKTKFGQINHLTEKSGGMGNVSTPSGRSVSSQSFAKTFEEFILGIVNKLNL